MAKGNTRLAQQRSIEIEKHESGSGPQPPWTWFCFVDRRGKDVIDAWHAGLSVVARANFSRARDHLSQLRFELWSKPHPASSIGHHIYVIRFKDESSKQWRVFGHSVASRRAFVMSFIATEKDNVYIPSDSAARAKKHQGIVASDFAKSTCPCFPKLKTAGN